MIDTIVVSQLCFMAKIEEYFKKEIEKYLEYKYRDKCDKV